MLNIERKMENMKNKSVILGILIILVVSLMTTGCGFYNLLDTEEFKAHFGALGYTNTDTEKGLYESKTYVVASKEDVPYKIEYYEFENDVEAKKIYKKYKDSIVDYITTDSENYETTGAVMSKTVAESENEYIVISRVKNTLIFIAGTVEFKTELDNLLEDIKY